MPAPARDRRHLPDVDLGRRLVELSPDAILVHDGTRVAFANSAALRLAGASSPEELVGQPVDRLLSPPYLRAVSNRLTGEADGSELTSPVRDTLRRLDGSTVEVEVRALAFMESGRPAAHLVLRDIRERLAGEQAVRELVERRHRGERLEAIGRLAGGVAHEVNNMMGVVLGFSDSLLAKESLPQTVQADLREIVNAAKRAAKVTRQLLAVGRLAAHQPRAIQLSDVLRYTEPVLRQILGSTRRVVLDASPDLLVSVDPGQLHELLVNLALNARDAMPNGGTLTLAATQQILTVEIASADGRLIPAARYATVTVRDTGIGMDPAIAARIFEPFFTTKPPDQGTGLGLAAAIGILEQHEGFLTVTSAPGAGTTFTIYLPILAKAEAETVMVPPASADIVAPASGATVLVVDDEPAVLTITARSLERSGYCVLQARDGGDALALMDREGPPALLLTDLTMPGIGGVELARQVRVRWPALPILFMSGNPAEELRQEGELMAGTDLLQKPFSITELTGRVSAALLLAPLSMTGSR